MLSPYESREDFALPIEYSSMQPDDYPAVRALWESTDGVGLDASDEEEPILAYLERNPGLSWVARDPDRPAGEEIVAAVLCGQDGRRGYLSHLAVAPVYRDRGIGRAVVDRCCAGLAAAGIRRCSIHVFAENAAGIAFWQTLGYSHRSDIVLLQRPCKQ